MKKHLFSGTSYALKYKFRDTNYILRIGIKTQIMPCSINVVTQIMKTKEIESSHKFSHPRYTFSDTSYVIGHKFS